MHFFPKHTNINQPHVTFTRRPNPPPTACRVALFIMSDDTSRLLPHSLATNEFTKIPISASTSFTKASFRNSPDATTMPVCGACLADSMLQDAVALLERSGTKFSINDVVRAALSAAVDPTQNGWFAIALEQARLLGNPGSTNYACDNHNRPTKADLAVYTNLLDRVNALRPTRAAALTENVWGRGFQIFYRTLCSFTPTETTADAGAGEAGPVAGAGRGRGGAGGGSGVAATGSDTDIVFVPLFGSMTPLFPWLPKRPVAFTPQTFRRLWQAATTQVLLAVCREDTLSRIYPHHPPALALQTWWSNMLNDVASLKYDLWSTTIQYEHIDVMFHVGVHDMRVSDAVKQRAIDAVKTAKTATEDWAAMQRIGDPVVFADFAPMFFCNIGAMYLLFALLVQGTGSEKGDFAPQFSSKRDAAEARRTSPFLKPLQAQFLHRMFYMAVLAMHNFSNDDAVPLSAIV